MSEGREKELSVGWKQDGEKNKLELMPYDALWEVGKVYTFGAKKYDARNWEKGIAYSRVFGALMRHSWAWWNREDTDPETGLSHMVHAAWNALTLVAFILRDQGKQLDDRP